MQKRAARRGTRALAFLLCLLMVVTLLPAMGANAAEGVGGNEVGKDAPAKVSENPVLDKFLTEDTNGNYTLTLTAYATGTTTTVTETSGKPLDIVLVLDQSGSMYTSNYLNPLKNAVTNFVESISKNAKEYDVDHRIALVGYASNNEDGKSKSGTISTGSSSSSWVNTGLFIDGKLKNYGSSSQNTNTQLTAKDYQKALVSVNTNGNVTSSITTAIKNIAASGSTRTSYGMEMANKVFENNPIEEGSDRQRIVVVFTDGQPGYSGYESKEADAAVGKSYTIKNTYGATVYTVGLYKNANNNVTTFMNYLSSNYPKAQSMSNSGVSQVTEYVAAAQVNSNGTYYYSNNGNYERVYYCDGLATHNSGWYTQQHAPFNHPGDRIDPNSTQFYVKQTTTPTVASKYYMTTSDSTELENIFESISQSIQHPSTDVTLNENAELRDQISSVFDVKDDSTITVSTVAGTYNAGGEPTWGKTEEISSGSFSGKNIGVTGFNYSDKYIAESHAGQKLVVTITGLIPNDGFGDSKMLSNNAGAGIYESAASTTPAAEFPSPWTKVPVYTKVLDFSMTANIATSVQQSSTATKNYGAFSTDANGNLTYKLGTSVAKGNLVFDGVDSALYYGRAYGDNTAANAWTKVNVIPANNVYFDDDLLNSSSTFTDGDQGYDAAVNDAKYGVEQVVDNTRREFTFTGTGIDVYCTTEGDSGWISAVLLNEDGTRAKDADGNNIKAIYMNNQYVSTPSLINVPTISIQNVPYGKYVLRIETMNSTNYKLDGVRIYNPANDDATNVAGASDIDVNAQFVNVRDTLLSATPKALIEGAVYVDQNHNTNDISVYEKVGPKNEVYLAQNQKVGFQLTGVPEGAKVLVGLSAPENQGSVTARVTSGDKATTVSVNSAIDMYYPVTVSSSGYVVIENTSNVLLSVTNVQITGGDSTSSAMLMSSPELLSYMADFDTLEVVQPEPEPTPDPEPAVSNNTVSAIIRAIWAQVMDSIGRLFGR